MDATTTPGVTACPKCHDLAPPQSKYCASCGSSLAAAAAPLCTGCGAPLAQESKFCARCGQPVL